jgi:hypothetical protein
MLGVAAASPAHLPPGADRSRNVGGGGTVLAVLLSLDDPLTIEGDFSGKVRQRVHPVPADVLPIVKTVFWLE